MINIKKAAIIAVIAILFASFIFSLFTAIFERPEFNDYCMDEDMYNPRPVVATECDDIDYPEEEAMACHEQDYEFVAVYDSNGCTTGYECRTCRRDYNLAIDDYEMMRFIFATILGLAAVIASIYMPFKRNSLKEWLLSGFLIGGLAAIFIATIMYFDDANRILKPIILLIEIALVIFVANKKIKKQK